MIFCSKCNDGKDQSEVITFKCSHTFCWKCIEEYLTKNINYKIKCPLPTCSHQIKDSEIRKVLAPEDIVKYEGFCVMKNRVHRCILPECGSIMGYEDRNVQYDCEQCTIYNCIYCKGAHKGMNCSESYSKQGESRKTVCDREIARASEVLRKKNAEKFRESITQIEKNILVPNSKIFICGICDKSVGIKAGITIRQCFHNICRECMSAHVENSQNILVNCPFIPCRFYLEDRECREILSDVAVAKFEMKSLNCAARQLQTTDRCRQINCEYFVEIDTTIKRWTCKLCSSENCVECNAIHTKKSCMEYKNSRILTEDEKKIEALIKEKKLMRCPNCQVLINKVSGCNWIKCSTCTTELCWINQTYRWGPKGPGDISGGCKCGVNGKKCHPDCGGCNADTACLIM